MDFDEINRSDADFCEINHDEVDFDQINHSDADFCEINHDEVEFDQINHYDADFLGDGVFEDEVSDDDVFNNEESEFEVISPILNDLVDQNHQKNTIIRI